MICVVILPPDLNDLPGANTLTFPMCMQAFLVCAALSVRERQT